MTRLTAIACLAVALAGLSAGQQTFNAQALDQQIEQAILDELIPGAVLWIGHDGQVIYHKAYGSRALVPSREPMTEDTIFDAASLTKVIATTSSLMKLFEESKIRPNNQITMYLPEFQSNKSNITIHNLITHFSNLHPDLDLQPP